MARPVKTRSYDNSGRAAAARETRRSVVRAAKELFLDRGYAATTLAQVAERAGVSVQTVYAQFGSKPALVKQIVDEAIAGDDEPVPIVDRPEVLAQIAEPDPQVRIRMHARFSAKRVTALEPIDRMVRSAAEVDPAMREQLERDQRGLLEGMAQMASLYAGRDELVVSVEVAAARIAALMSPELYRRTVLDHGWSLEDYTSWLGDLMAASVLRPVTGRR
jgi:AcrR family transcriptional regulator